MAHRVDFELGSKDGKGSYGRGQYFFLILDGQTTISQLFEQGEAQARKICENAGEEFVELMINRVHAQ